MPHGAQRTPAVTRIGVLMAAAWFVFSVPIEAAEPTAKSLGEVYAVEVRPLLERYCHECHGAELAEADIDLAALTDWEGVSKRSRTWQRVGEMLGSGLMPPEDAAQPTEAERKRLKQWVHDYLALEARGRAGDPGRVVLRRLSNAEYTYTLRDLTNVESLDPARQFPVDGAAGEGFTNTGSALVMSPALVTKYLDAAKEVASHAVLLPNGFRFSQHQTSRDWTEEILREIRALYGEFTDARGGEQVNLQGVVFDTNEGGRLPLEKYLAATLVERDALAINAKTIEAVAREHGLNAKYLGTLWSALSEKKPSLVLDSLRARWRSAEPKDAAALAADIAAWQKALWQFTTVGHIGKVGGPKRWMEPVSPLLTRQDVRFKIPAASAGQIITLSLVATDAGDGNEHDFIVWEQPRLVAPGRPDLLLRDVRAAAGHGDEVFAVAAKNSTGADDGSHNLMGLAPAIFGKHPKGTALDAASLCVQAPSAIEVRLPADLADGCELVTTCTLDENSGAEGSVQVQIVDGQPAREASLVPSEITATVAEGPWTDNNRRIAFSAPILVAEKSAARTRIESAFDEFRQLFPAALCYTKIVPVDEVVTLNLFYREDDHLARLMLDESQQKRLDQLWSELHYVSRDALTQVDALAQLIEYATQDADPTAFEPLRPSFDERAAAFRQQLIDTQPKHLDALTEFAIKAYRRPLTANEAADLRALYESLRAQEIGHEEAFRLMLTRVLVAPDFLYRVERPQAGESPSPVSDWEVASRLSYFLWSSQPDEELRELAAAGRLRDPGMLIAQSRRMRHDGKVRRLATEFACQWLQIHDFEQFDEKSERHFPTFAGLRSAMYEESIRFFTDLFQTDGSVLDILNADYAFLNEELAQHYAIPDVSGAEWRRVEGVQKYSRGGILGMAAILARQSGASRTSPILRGNWTSEVLLGERLPRPPEGVPPLPNDEAETEGLTVRQLVEKHVRDPKCAVCHRRIDPYGFALEAFDAVGRYREKDAGDRAIDTYAMTMDGTPLQGFEGLRNYLLVERRAAFVRQFCRKLLGYALGRSVQLSDEPLLVEIEAQLKGSDYQVASAVETIVLSRQFREMRGRDAAYDEDIVSP